MREEFVIMRESNGNCKVFRRFDTLEETEKFLGEYKQDGFLPDADFWIKKVWTTRKAEKKHK